jgi:hypothetical protein
LTLGGGRRKISVPPPSTRQPRPRMPRKAFTVEEANALVPVLETVLRKIEGQKVSALGHHEKLQVLDVLWGERLDDTLNPDFVEAEEHRQEILDAIREIEALIQEDILARGIRFPQGGLEHGLLDFPTTWEGRWVYLCWHRGEPRVEAWHEVDSGYAGRQPISPEQTRRMGREDDPADVDDSMLDF